MPGTLPAHLASQAASDPCFAWGPAIAGVSDASTTIPQTIKARMCFLSNLKRYLSRLRPSNQCPTASRLDELSLAQINSHDAGPKSVGGNLWIDYRWSASLVQSLGIVVNGAWRAIPAERCGSPWLLSAKAATAADMFFVADLTQTCHRLCIAALGIMWATLVPTRYWITSSAVANSVSGTSMPRNLAVPRLITNSNLVDSTTGRSAGLAPLRILPV
jgi:hypothetical protein